MPEPTRRERRRAQQRTHLYTTALKLFVERGFDQVTVDDIATAADVAKGTFFNYFPTKEHLLIEYRGGLFETLHSYGASLTGDSARALFKKFFRKLARLVKGEGERYEMLFQELLARPHLLALASGEGGSYRPYFQRYLEIGQAAGEVPAAADLELLAETIRDLWGGASMHWMMERSGASLETRVLRRIDFLFDLLELGVD